MCVHACVRMSVCACPINVTGFELLLKNSVITDMVDWALISSYLLTFAVIFQGLCGDRLGVRLCPFTCGFCALFNSSLCQDIVLHDGCRDLKDAENICDNVPVATDVCPVTCSLCGEFEFVLSVGLILVW